MTHPPRLTPPRVPRCRPLVEELESRWVPAAIVYSTSALDGPNNLELRLNSNLSRLQLFDNGTLVAQQSLNTLTSVQITGAAGEADTLTVNYSPAFFTKPITFSGGAGNGDGIVVSADVNFTLSNTSLTTSQGSPVTLAGVERATLTGGAGANRIDASGFSGSTTLTGGAGNDTLTGGSGIDDLRGDLGNDRLVSVTGGDDAVNGGGGDDTYRLDPGSVISVVDDGGSDTIDLSNITVGGVTVTAGGTSAEVFETSLPASRVLISARIETFLGTNADDKFTSTNTDTTLAQKFVGGAGSDLFIDQASTDLIFVGGAETGSTLLGGGGNDRYILNPGSVISVIDDGGNDSIDLSTVTSGGATVSLGDTGGSASVPTGTVAISGAFENLTGTSFSDTISGNSLNNNIDGGGGTDSIAGGGGMDTLAGGAGTDTLVGGLGDTVFRSIPGSDDIFFDSGGIDTIDFSDALRGITLDLNLSGGQLQTVDSAGNRVALNGVFENVIGSAFEDKFTGNGEDNLILGGGGDDRLGGGPGRDVLIGGAGSDRIVASSDSDLLIGGVTAFDGNLTALLAIQAEWSSSRDYATRVANLRGTDNPAFGDRLNGNFFLKATDSVPGPDSDQTVFDDSAADTLTGSQQLDWFFLFQSDVVTDTNKDESIN